MDFQSTKVQWDNFLESTIWQDLKNYIIEGIEIYRDALEEPEISREKSHGANFESDSMIRGRLREIREFVEMVEIEIPSDMEMQNARRPDSHE